MWVEKKSKNELFIKIELYALKRGWKHLEEQYTFVDGLAFIDEQKETFDSTYVGFGVFPFQNLSGFLAD